MKNYWKDWINNRVDLLSTPLGATVSILSFVAGILLGKFILNFL